MVNFEVVRLGLEGVSLALVERGFSSRHMEGDRPHEMTPGPATYESQPGNVGDVVRCCIEGFLGPSNDRFDGC